MTELSALVYWHWLILAGLLLIIEVLSFTTVLLWAGTAALLTALLAYVLPSASWQLQALYFAVCTLILLGLTRRWVSGNKTQETTLNRRADKLVGQSFTLSEAIVNGAGYVNVHDTLWQVSGPDLAAGASIRVLSVDDNVLRVEAKL